MPTSVPKTPNTISITSGCRYGSRNWPPSAIKTTMKENTNPFSVKQALGLHKNWTKKPIAKNGTAVRNCTYTSAQ